MKHFEKRPYSGPADRPGRNVSKHRAGLGSPVGLLARDAAWATRRGERGLARLLHLNTALAPEAVYVSAHLRWAYASHHQGLAYGAGGGSHRRTAGVDHRSTPDEAGNPAGRSDFALAGNGYFWRFLLAWRKHGHQGTRRQLCRRFRHLLPTAQRRGGDDTNDGIDDGAWGGGERNKGPDRPAA